MAKPMKNVFKKPYAFGILYGSLLVSFSIFVLLDTFVIPKGITKVVEGETAEGTEGVTEEAAGGEALYTDSFYRDDKITVNITVTREYETQIYIADIKLKNISLLKTAFARNTYGRNIKQATSEIAEENKAILAINGDYYGFRDYGYVIRNGTLYRDNGNAAEALAVMADGSFQIFKEDSVSASSLLEEGALQVLSFGPVLLEDSTIMVSEDTEVGKAMLSNPRTAMGMVSPLHYVFVVSDGRSEESTGLSLYQLAMILQELDCSTAYNLDGGGSSTIWFNGKVINNPTDGRRAGERQVSDIVYIGY